MLEDKYERIVNLVLTVFLIFVVGVQIGIHQGRELQKQDLQEIYGYSNSN